MDALRTALSRVGGEHRAILEWFAENERDVGARPWRENGHSFISGVDVPVVAQRGIHVPSRWKYAVSVTATKASKYGDGAPVDQGDGTWVLLYNAHRGGEGQGTGSRWNRALVRCALDRVPVGVFVPASGSAYRNLGLAMVDGYYPETDTFELHGPVASSSQVDLFDFSLLDQSDVRGEQPWALVAREEELSVESDERVRVQAMIVRRERQESFRRTLLDLYSTCAVTDYDAEETLEAAHVLQYRGKSSHTPQNGLLLRADVHELFDRHLVGVDPADGTVRVARRLKTTRYADLEGKKLRLPKSSSDWPSKRRLEMHFEVFLERA